MPTFLRVSSDCFINIENIKSFSFFVKGLKCSIESSPELDCVYQGCITINLLDESPDEDIYLGYFATQKEASKQLYDTVWKLFEKCDIVDWAGNEDNGKFKRDEIDFGSRL